MTALTVATTAAAARGRRRRCITRMSTGVPGWVATIHLCFIPLAVPLVTSDVLHSCSFLLERCARSHADGEANTPQRTGTVPSWAYGPDGSRNSPWRYGGPNGNTTNGLDTVDPGGTIEEVEEGGTAPAQAAQPLTTATAVLPVAATNPYDTQQPHTHYHINEDDGSGRRRRYSHGRSHGRHGRRRRHDDSYDGGILTLVDRERRRDSERQMADADASHRREAMMMGLVDRERDRDRGGGGAGLDARDVLGMLLDGEAERRRRERRREEDAEDERGRSSSGGGGGDRWKGAFDALSRRVDEMLLLGRDGYSSAGEERGGSGKKVGIKRTNAASSGRKTAARVKFTKAHNGSSSAGDSNNAPGAGSLPSSAKKGASAGGKVVFSRGNGEDHDASSGDTDTDDDETSGPSSRAGGTRVRARGRAWRRAGSLSTSVD